MRETACALAGLMAAWLGFALLALSQERHFVRVYQSTMPPAPFLLVQRAIGFIAIGVSLVCCIAGHGVSFGSLLWVLSLSAAAMAMALTLTWRPRWLSGLARVLGLVLSFSSLPR